MNQGSINPPPDGVGTPKNNLVWASSEIAEALNKQKQQSSNKISTTILLEFKIAKI